MKENSYNDRLFDAMIKIAADEALKQEMEEMPSCEELNEQYKPSPSLDKKIRKKIFQHKFKKKTSAWKKIGVKIAACAALIIIFSGATLMTVEATRNYILNAITKWKEDYFSIQHKKQDNETDIKNYRPTYLPEGFIETSTNAIGDILRIVYENESSVKIIFNQSPAQSSHILADHEDKKYIDVKINGHTAYLFKAAGNDKNNTVLWESGGIIFKISSEVESDELILIAESIKK